MSVFSDGKLYQEKVQSIMYLRHSNSGGKSASSSMPSLSPTVFADAPHEGTQHQLYYTDLKALSASNTGKIIKYFPSVCYLECNYKWIDQQCFYECTGL